MTLSREIVNLMRSDLLNQADQVRAVGQVTIVEVELRRALVGVLIEVINTRCIKGGATPLESMYFITTRE
jgi:hypothetical protein